MVLKKVNRKTFALPLFVLFVNNLNIKGLRIRGENLSYNLFFWMKKRELITARALLPMLLKRIKPVVTMKKKKVGGVNYRIPVFLFSHKGERSSIKWVVQVSCGRKLGSRQKCLQAEFSSFLIGAGKSLEKKRALYDQALLNRAYIKYL